MWAAWADNPAIVKMLIAHGARLDAMDHDGLTPLAIAAQNAKVKVIPVLLDSGADVNAPVTKGEYTPLMLASLSGSNALATSLIEHGANVNAANSGGVTALMIAAAGNHSAIAGLLLKLAPTPTRAAMTAERRSASPEATAATPSSRS